MSMKGTGDTDLREIDRWENGVGWIAYPDEELQRASHAFAVDDDVWLVDPVDAVGVDDLLAEFGEVAGVVVTLGRHKRDAGSIAMRHDVRVYIPDWMTGVAPELNAPVERFGRELADTGVRVLTVRDSTIPPWQEVALYHDESETLLVSESVGTADHYLAPGERLGVHPMTRLFPPKRALGGLSPDRLLVGHGEGITEDASSALREALGESRRTAPSLYGKTVKSFLSG